MHSSITDVPVAANCAHSSIVAGASYPFNQTTWCVASKYNQVSASMCCLIRMVEFSFSLGHTRLRRLCRPHLAQKASPDEWRPTSTSSRRRADQPRDGDTNPGYGRDVSDHYSPTNPKGSNPQ